VRSSWRSKIRSVLRAKSKAESEQGLVSQRLNTKTGGLNFESIEQRHTWGKSEHVRLLKSLRAQELRQPTSVEWVEESFRHFGLELQVNDWSKLATALEAPFAFNNFLCNQAKQGAYNFSRYDQECR
jgi:hypothetical protein